MGMPVEELRRGGGREEGRWERREPLLFLGCILSLLFLTLILSHLVLSSTWRVV